MIWVLLSRNKEKIKIIKIRFQDFRILLVKVKIRTRFSKISRISSISSRIVVFREIRGIRGIKVIFGRIKAIISKILQILIMEEIFGVVKAEIQEITKIFPTIPIISKTTKILTKIIIEMT